jgi:hypothetical protein
MITVSFHNGNVSGDLVRAQKAVFDHFGYTDHLQIHTNLSHGEAIDEWLNTRHWDEVAIFDIDCIPLNPVILVEAEEKAKEGRLFGIEQSANHLSNERYVGAPFICFGRSLWASIGKPSFKETKTEDVTFRQLPVRNHAGNFLTALCLVLARHTKDTYTTPSKAGFSTAARPGLLRNVRRS